MQHSALPFGIYRHCATTMFATRLCGTSQRWHLPQVTYAELTTSTSPSLPPKGTWNLPRAANAYFLGMLDVLRGNRIIVIYLMARQLWGTYQIKMHRATTTLCSNCTY